MLAETMRVTPVLETIVPFLSTQFLPPEPPTPSSALISEIAFWIESVVENSWTKLEPTYWKRGD
jgi:hypothetical protein